MQIEITEILMSSWSLGCGTSLECDHEYTGIRTVPVDMTDQQGLHSESQTVVKICDDCREEFPYED